MANSIALNPWMEAILGLEFTDADRDIFDISDPAEKAHRLQEQFFPKFRKLLASATALIQGIYGPESLEGLTESWRPKPKGPPFRVTDFDDVYVGLVGARHEGGLAFRKPDGTPLQYGLSHLVFRVLRAGAITVDYRPVLFSIAPEFRELISTTFGEKIEQIDTICAAHFVSHESAMLRLESIRNAIEPAQLGELFMAAPVALPTRGNSDLRRLVVTFSALYPLLRTVTDLSVAKAPNLDALMEQYRTWWMEDDRGPRIFIPERFELG